MHASYEPANLPDEHTQHEQMPSIDPCCAGSYQPGPSSPGECYSVTQCTTVCQRLSTSYMLLLVVFSSLCNIGGVALDYGMAALYDQLPTAAVCLGRWW